MPTLYTLLKKLAQKPCKGTFFEDLYLNSQPLIPASSTDRSLGLRKAVDKVYNINLSKLRENVYAIRIDV